MYGIDVFDSWLYDDQRPFDYLCRLEIFERLKKKTDTGYFEDLIKKYLLNNTHASIVTVNPRKGLAARREKALEEKLEAYRQSLSEEEQKKIMEDTVHLKEYQDEPETKEALASIPMLERKDLGTETVKIYNTPERLEDTLVLHHNLNTNGICYLTLLFELKKVPEALLPYVGILKSVLEYVDTKHYKYGELFNEINANSGGILFGVQAFADAKNNQSARPMLGIKAKTLYDKIPFVFEMIQEILFTSKLDDEKRLYEIIARMKSRLQMSLSQAGHSTAVMRALSYFSANAFFQERTAGIDFYGLLDDIETHFQERKEGLIKNLQTLMGMIFRPENLMVSCTADEEGYALARKEILPFKQGLYTEEMADVTFKPVYEIKNEAFQTSGQVQYVATAGNFREAGYEYTGCLRILKVMLSYEYLWMNIRVKGGAYGCMSNFRRSGDSYLVSYRDPNLAKTFETFAGTADFIRNFQADEREMTKYVIGTISELDTPMTPSAKGSMSLDAWFSHVTEEDLKKERMEILQASVEDIRGLADIVDSVVKQNRICVVGSEEKIQQEKEFFKTIKHLL